MNGFNIIAIGRAAGEIQAPVSVIVRIAADLGIEPVGLINGVVHFDAADVERIAARLRSLDQQRSGSVAGRQNIH